jgi:hypothetical protein
MGAWYFLRLRMMTGVLLILSLVLVGAGCTAGPSTWYVATTGDDTANDCHSQQSPCKTLQWVIDHAKDGDQILIADGIYTGRVIIGAKDLAIHGSGPDTILQNPYTGGDKHLYGAVIEVTCDQCSKAVSISDLTMRWGLALNGGVISVKAVSLTMTDVTVEKGVAHTNGGCIYIHPGTTVSLDRVVVQDCAAQDKVSNPALESAPECIAVWGCYGNGGGIINHGFLTMSNSIIQKNVGDTNGGGLVNWSDGTARLIGTRVESNTTTGNNPSGLTAGGGIYNLGDLTILSTTFKSNRAQEGGGILNRETGTTRIRASTITDSSSDGVNNGGVMYLTNVTISGSAHSGIEMGMYQGEENSSIYATHVTIAKNIDYGFYHNNGTVYFQNVLLANNGKDCQTEIQWISGMNNLSSDGTCPLYGNGSQTGVDPLLGPLANNGGPTWTHALLLGSPAIDAGAHLTGLPRDTDQRGSPRPVDGNGDGIEESDIGAYEYTPAALPMTLDVGEELSLQVPTLISLPNPTNCRMGPDPVYPILVTLPPDTIHIVDGRNEAGDWYRLLPADNALCWVPASSGSIDTDPSVLLIRKVQDVPTPTNTPFSGSGTFTFQVPGNCRSGPGANYDVLSTVPAGTTVPLDGRNLDASWYRIQMREKSCWVSALIGVIDLDPSTLQIRAAPPSPTPIYIRPTITITITSSSPVTNCSLYTSMEPCLLDSVCDWIMPGGPCVNK